MKECSKCKTIKPPDEFNVNRALKDGRDSMCRVCRQEHRLVYIKKQPMLKGVTRKEYAKQYSKNRYTPRSHKQKCLVCGTVFDTKCSKMCSDKCRRERWNGMARDSRVPKLIVCPICGDTFKKLGTHVTCGKAECRKTYRNNNERAFREEVRSHYGICCAVCGSTCGLEIDHKYGYGRDHRREVVHSPTSSNTFYQWLKNNNYPKDYTVNGVTYKDGFRVLCKEHNNRQPRKGRNNAWYNK